MTVEPIDYPDAMPDVELPDDVDAVVIDLDRVAAAKVEELRTARGAALRWKNCADELRTELLRIMGPAMGATADGVPVLRREPRETWTIDRNKLRRDYPEVWRVCTSQGITQTLRLLS